MSKTLNAIVFDIYAVERDVVVLKAYATDANLLSFKRTAPKRTKDFPGMEKTEVKHTLIDPATGAVIGIQTVSTSIRADATAVNREILTGVTTDALASAIYGDLVSDQRLPLTV